MSTRVVLASGIFLADSSTVVSDVPCECILIRATTKAATIITNPSPMRVVHLSDNVNPSRTHSMGLTRPRPIAQDSHTYIATRPVSKTNTAGTINGIAGDERSKSAGLSFDDFLSTQKR